MTFKLICDYNLKEICNYYDIEPIDIKIIERKEPIEKGENIFLPIITKEGIIKAKWGLIPPFIKGIEKAKALRIYTVNNHNILSNPHIRGSIRSRRCLIPINAYEINNRQINVFFKRIFSIGGVYNTWEYKGKRYTGFAIILTKSNKKLSDIGKYMPVYLQREEEKMWLKDKRLRVIRELCDTYENELGERNKY